MGKEGHRRHCATTGPGVKSEGVSGRHGKADLHRAVSNYISAPIYFPDLGQCLLGTVISAAWRDMVIYNQTQKTSRNPIRGALFPLIGTRQLISIQMCLCRTGDTYTCTTLHLWMCFSFSRQAQGISIHPPIKFLSALNCLLVVIYTSIKLPIEGENWFDSIADMICTCFGPRIRSICAKPLSLWCAVVWGAHLHSQNSGQWGQRKCPWSSKHRSLWALT